MSENKPQKGICRSTGMLCESPHHWIKPIRPIGQEIVMQAFDALTDERRHEILMELGIDDGWEASGE